MITFAKLSEQFYGLTAEWGIPWLVPTLVVMTIVVGVIVAYIAVAAMFLIWWERKISAHIQVRFGPMRVGGWHGWAQSIADGIKLLLKEDIIPARADKVVFVLAPMVVFAASLATYVTVPWAPGLIVKDLNIGLLYMVAISSLTVVGIIMAGWSSNNKYATLGAMRSAAQAVSYEVPLVLSLLGPVMLAGTMSMGQLVEAQGGTWFGFLPRWFVFPQIVAFLVYFICALAECNRLPFDIPEAESELVAGFHVEYSGMRFAIFFLAGIRQHGRGGGDRDDPLPGGVARPLAADPGPAGRGRPRPLQPGLVPGQSLFPDLRDDVAALDLEPAARGPVDGLRLEGLAPHRLRQPDHHRVGGNALEVADAG